MEAREDPSEDAESWPPTPAVGKALTRQETRSLSRPVVESQCDVAERKNGEELPHISEGTRHASPVNPWLAISLPQHPDQHRPALGPPRRRSGVGECGPSGFDGRNRKEGRPMVPPSNHWNYHCHSGLTRAALPWIGASALRLQRADAPVEIEYI